MQRKSALIGAVVIAAAGVWAQPGGDVGVLKVQGNVYMVVAGGRNIAAQVGPDGILLVDTATGAEAPGVAAALKKLSDKPIVWIVNTNADRDHIGGNAALPRAMGATERQLPRVVAQENVLNRLSAAAKGSAGDVPDVLWPNDEYAGAGKDFAFNGEALVITHVAAAHTDGDSLVHFRRSDVLATGDVFTPGRYPVVDLQRGGTLQGLLDALNLILRITVPLKYEEAGTYVIPGHGRLCDEADVVEYRNMVTIVRDRVRDMIRKDMTLEQVKAARPTRDYDTQYDAENAGSFVEAVYRSLSGRK
ncbi:MAG TPA: MBL fold metallo-hydrolase [Bryobacteraceae bacterium]|nr:MBL fold metallo-hydrolase [Bryobacteraceae bacterium]